MNKQVGKLKLPYAQYINVYIGSYFNHYNGIVVFNNKPVLSKESHQHQDKWYDLLDEYNRDIIIGCIYLGDFRMLYPDIDLSILLNEHGNSKTLEPFELIEAHLECILDDNGKMYSLDFNIDGYVK